jgi:hypothetical protein
VAQAAEKIQALHRLKAISLEFAAGLVGETFHRDFANRRQLASYVGTPTAEAWAPVNTPLRCLTARRGSHLKPRPGSDRNASL